MTGPTYTLHVGDTRAVLATMEPASVDLVLSSPPFLALRSYLPDDDPAKALEQGAEATPGEFIDGLLDVVELCADVLAPHGSICFELGDTYSGSGGAGGDYNADGLRAGQARFDGSASKAFGTGQAPRPERSRTNRPGDDWPAAKSLCLVPELFRLALAYGVNPLTGRTTPRWRVRNVVRWVRPNPPVGELGDKFRPATSDMVIACKARDRFFDLDAVRTEHKRDSSNNLKHGRDEVPERNMNHGRDGFVNGGNPAGAPPLDWWKISPKGYPGSHYAVWPAELLLRPIKAMCPERVCTTCGEPSRRLVESIRTVARPQRQSMAARSTDPGFGQEGHTTYTTVGWTDCGHDNWRAGIVLDPYLGSGTTMEVAHGLGRSCVGIDLDRRNVHLVNERMGMWAPDVIDHLAAEATA